MTSLEIGEIISSLGFADKHVAESRLTICRKCDHFSNYRCAKCGCFMAVKTRIKSLSCPIGLWGAIDKD